MADYDSDSSGGVDDIETSVLLGYASREPTSDDFSQLGGHPTWLDGSTAPSGALARCQICNSFMSLLLQINGDIPERFPGHDRRLYIWTCRRKPCRRKDGSIRVVRGVRHDKVNVPSKKSTASNQAAPAPRPETAKQPAINLGETLFGVKSPSNFQANPFAPSGSNTNVPAPMNPFAAASSLAAKPPQRPLTEQKLDTNTLSATFASKARINSPPADSTPIPYTPWPSASDFPAPYPSFHLDADKEYIEAIDANSHIPSQATLDNDSSGPSSAAEDKLAFESTMDKTFQKFADRLSQNPEQVLRYEFGGAPLLYSKKDTVGKRLAPAILGESSGGSNGKIKVVSLKGGQSKSADGDMKLGLPRCGNCGAERVFELQLTPHAILELESEEMGLEGMDWGTVIIGVCAKDCSQKGKGEGEVGYVEEWVGVQWEELTKK